MLIAQISDLHIGRDRDNPHEVNVRRLNFVIDRLIAMHPRPDLLLVTGDLVERGDDDDAYRHVRALIGRWQGPTMFALGSHDNRERLLATMRIPPDPNGFVQYEADVGGLRLIVIDTVEPGRHGGSFCEKRAAWLKQRLAEKPKQPTLIALHHPPVDIGIQWISPDEHEEWVERLKAVVRPARQVKALLSGHVHRPVTTTFAGKPLSICPSTAPALAMDLEPINPRHPDHRPLVLVDPPAFAIHCWNGEHLVTHFDVAGPRHVQATYDSNVQPLIKEFLIERGIGWS